MTRTIDPCDTMRNNLIAAALGLQQCTKTAANIVPLPGTGRFVTIGTPAEVAGLLAAPNCGACPGDGTICPTRCRLAEESPPLGRTSLPEDVAAVFAACGFEIRSTDPAEKHPLAVCGSLDAAGLVVETLLTRKQAGAPIDALSDDDLWHIAGIVNTLAGGSLFNVSQYDCITAIRAGFMDPDSGREYEKARAAVLEGAAS